MAHDWAKGQATGLVPTAEGSEMIATVQAFHAAYVQSTGIEISLRPEREMVWAAFIKEGFTEDDVRLVGEWLRRKVQKEERNVGCLKFMNMISRFDDFEMELALCKAEMRNFKAPPSERDKTIRAFRPEQEAVKQTAKPAKELVEKAIQDLRRAAQ